MLLRLLIRLYWWAIPAARRRTCLFNESCSHYVFRRRGQGFVLGWSALLERYRQCRPGYRIVELQTNEGTIVVLADSTVRDLGEMSERVRREAVRPLSSGSGGAATGISS